MQATFDQIAQQLREAATGDNGDYVELLDRVILEAKNLRLNALYQIGGEAFKRTEAVDELELPEAERQFAKDDKVITSKGYIGYVHGYDKRGKVVVNIVHAACEFDETELKKRDY